jgi:hypothetical protein
MPGRRLSILAVTSLAVLLGLVCAYFAQAGLIVQRNTFTASIVSVRGGCIWLYRGCFEIKSFHWTGPAAKYITLQPGLHFYFPMKAARPTTRKSLWDFQIINDPMATGLRFPVWCLMPPCTMAPMLWLRRRRRNLGRGFAVEPQAA